MINVGFVGKHPAVGFNISINEHAQMQLLRSLVALGRHLSDEKLSRIVRNESTVNLMLTHLSYKGRTGWDARLATYPCSLESLQEQPSTHAAAPTHEIDRRNMFVVQCPLCTQQSARHRYKFQYEDLYAKIRCTECLKLSAIKYWKCNCGELWHTCMVHVCTEKVRPKVSKVKPRSSSNKEGADKASSNRLLHNATFDQLLDDDFKEQTKRAKRLDEEEHGVNIVVPSQSSNQLRSSMLSPNLRERFAHLFSG